MGLRRTKLEIINDILLSIIDRGGSIKPTHLLYKSNLSHKKMTEYIEELIGKGLIEELIDRKGNRFFEITDKGREYIVEYKRVQEFSDAFGF